MNKKVFFSLIAFIGIQQMATAQEKTTQTLKASPTPTDTWYVGGNIGFNTFFGEGNNFMRKNDMYIASIKDNSNISIRLEAGKELTKLWTIRAMTGFQTFSYPNNQLTPKADGSYPISKFTNECLLTDAVFNLTNCFWSSVFGNKMGINAFSGLGINILNDNVDHSKLGGLWRIGIEGNYAINAQTKICLGLESNFTTDNYNDIVRRPKPFDMYTNVTIGIKYYLTKK